MQIHTHSENKYNHKVQDLVADRKVRNKKNTNGNTATNTNSIIDANTYTFIKQIQAQSTRSCC